VSHLVDLVFHSSLKFSALVSSGTGPIKTSEKIATNPEKKFLKIQVFQGAFSHSFPALNIVLASFASHPSENK
jgi:hypothetical protein